MKSTLKGLAAALTVAMFSVSTAFAAAPVITEVVIGYSVAPAYVTITGTGLCGSPCAKPILVLSGSTNLTVTSYSGTSVTAWLPTGMTDGQYSLVLTAGSSGSVSQQLVVAATIVSVGTTTTLAPGSSATVTISGSQIAPVLSFGIPQGLTGAIGPQGPIGATGPQGPAGLGLVEYGGSLGGGPGALGSIANHGATDDTAFGVNALAFDTTGQNDAFGNNALAGNISGVANGAFGRNALTTNSSGGFNTAIGYGAMNANISGSNNVAVGAGALIFPEQSNYNTAVGSSAMEYMTTGSNNTGVGDQVLEYSTGSNNVALGYEAGYSISTGSWNVDIGNLGTSSDSGFIRIGTAGNQTATFIAGINGVQTGLPGVPVLVDANGQLGTISSSRRYKEDIRPMADVSERLFKLRPVTFHYKKPDATGHKPLQFGLIAEEVAETFPELVIYNKEGQPETVAYHLLASLLLNELQKEHQKIETASTEIAAERQELNAMKVQIAKVQNLQDELAQCEQALKDLRQQTALAAMHTSLRSKGVQRVSESRQ